MEALYTPNYESDADASVRGLVGAGDAAGALYFWLHSRCFAEHNSIRLSMTFLAEKLGVERKTVSNAAKRLQDAGLISYESRSGRGCTFHLLNVRAECWGRPKAGGESYPTRESGNERLPHRGVEGAEGGSRATRNLSRGEPTTKLDLQDKPNYETYQGRVISIYD